MQSCVTFHRLVFRFGKSVQRQKKNKKGKANASQNKRGVFATTQANAKNTTFILPSRTCYPTNQYRKMAEFCSQCSPFDDEYDIDIFRIALKLKNGHSTNILCEGCNIRAVYKDEQGLLYLGKSENNTIKLYPVKLEELMK